MAPAQSIQTHPSESLQAGDLLGRYQLLCPIARGGMGQVWAARQSGRLGLPKLVAIKTAIPIESSSYAQVQEYLFDEAQVAASVDHPNVCKILELGQEGDVLFIAMEWLNGAPLSTLVGKLPHRRLDYRMAAYLLTQACSGLHAAHELTDEEGVLLDVVHRDATPHNFMITSAGELKVMDFGIVKSKNQQHQATQTGELKGKISYLAPELIRGKCVDRRADVFTLGCVLYVVTVGRSPFAPVAGQDAGRTILHIMEGNYALPSEVIPDYPPELEAIVVRALATQVEDRFQSAEEMRLALEEYLNQASRPVSREEVAALLLEHCGPAVEHRRNEIRSAQKLFDSQAGSARSGTFRARESSEFSANPLSLSLPLAIQGASSSETTLPSEPTPPPLIEPHPTPLIESSGARAPRRSIVVAAACVLCIAGFAASLFVATRSTATDTRQVAPTREPAPLASVVSTPGPARSATPDSSEISGALADRVEPVDSSSNPASSAPVPRALRRARQTRVATASSQPPSQEAPQAAPEPHSTSDSGAFSQSLPRKPRLAIDESDPFGK